MTMNAKVMGLESSDGDRCECCGTRCPKRRVVLNLDGETVRYGTACAALKLLGSKKEKTTIEAMARNADRERFESQPGTWIDGGGKVIIVGTRRSLGWQVRYYPGAKFIKSDE